MIVIELVLLFIYMLSSIYRLIFYDIYTQTQKSASEMIDLDIEIKVSAIIAKNLVLEVVKIDEDDIYTIVLFEINVLEFDI